MQIIKDLLRAILTDGRVRGAFIALLGAVVAVIAQHLGVSP